MAGPGNAKDREELYTERGRNGVVLGRLFAFYSGKGTTPTSYTGNLALGSHSNGAGAFLIDGIGPPIETVVSCEEIVVVSIECEVFDDLNVTVLYNVLPDDIYVLFNTSTGQILQPLSVTPIVGGVIVLFDDESPPADPGAWSFKIMRATNPTGCFFVKSNCLVIAGAVCLLTITDMVGDGVFPNFPLIPGSVGHSITLTGTGFLSGGPLVVVFENTSPPFNPLDITLVTIIDDTSLTIDFDARDGGFPASDGFYAVRITLVDDPACEATIGFEFFEPQVGVIGV